MTVNSITISHNIGATSGAGLHNQGDLTVEVQDGEDMTPLFSYGFESGTTDAWDDTVPGSS